MEWLNQPEAWIALATLTVLEIVLGIDNIIFISILTGKLPKDQQKSARLIGLALAMVMRIGLLFSLSLIMRLKHPLFTVFSQEISGRDLILLGGGLFLLAKATHEIHAKLEAVEGEGDKKITRSLITTLIQIMLLDIVFSLDSVITAVGMAEHISVMVLAVMIAVLFMMLFAGSISSFVEAHPTIKMLALSFLLLIGVTLVAESFDQHIPKGYVYFAMAFSVFVEVLNIKLRKNAKQPVELRQEFTNKS